MNFVVVCANYTVKRGANQESIHNTSKNQEKRVDNVELYGYNTIIDTNNNTIETQTNTHKQLNGGKFHKKGR